MSKAKLLELNQAQKQFTNEAVYLVKMLSDQNQGADITMGLAMLSRLLGESLQRSLEESANEAIALDMGGGA